MVVRDYIQSLLPGAVVLAGPAEVNISSNMGFDVLAVTTSVIIPLETLGYKGRVSNQDEAMILEQLSHYEQFRSYLQRKLNGRINDNLAKQYDLEDMYLLVTLLRSQPFVINPSNRAEPHPKSYGASWTSNPVYNHVMIETQIAIDLYDASFEAGRRFQRLCRQSDNSSPPSQELVDLAFITLHSYSPDYLAEHSGLELCNMIRTAGAKILDQIEVQQLRI